MIALDELWYIFYKAQNLVQWKDGLIGLFIWFVLCEDKLTC